MLITSLHAQKVIATQKLTISILISFHFVVISILGVNAATRKEYNTKD